MFRLDKIIKGEDTEVWTGLYGDINNWKWSLERRGFYREQEAEFRMWQNTYYTILTGQSACANIGSTGKWFDVWCHENHTFICYNGKRRTTKWVKVQYSLWSSLTPLIAYSKAGKLKINKSQKPLSFIWGK